MIDTNVPFFDQIVRLLNKKVLNLSEYEIGNLYLKWNENFNEKDKSLDNCILKGQVNSAQHIPEGGRMLGIDLPSWFGRYSQKRILFLGIDPVRNEKEFTRINKDADHDVIVGTPYAFHLQGFRERRCASYWQIIENLSEKNFVYVTDIYKSFFYFEKLRSYNYWKSKSNLNTVHLNILMEEIGIIEPNLIVTFGAIAYRSIENSVTNIPILPMMHLSGSVRFGNLKNFLALNRYSLDKDNRIEAGRIYAEIIANKLHNG